MTRWTQTIEVPSDPIADGTSAISQNIGFQAKSVTINNLTGYWAYLPDADAYVPPWWYGVVLSLEHATDYARVMWKSPFGGAQTITTPGATANPGLTLIFSSDDILPRSGSSVIGTPPSNSTLVGPPPISTGFSAGIIPPRVVVALPTLPDVKYPQGALVFLTTDQQLYRNTTGLIWSVEVPAVNISGTIINTQIADGSISTPKMTANTINGNRITAGTLAADKIIANSITAGQIAVGAIGADEIAAHVIGADKINIGNVAGASLLTNSGFETGDLTGWVEYDPSSVIVPSVERVSTADKQTGTGYYQCAIARTGSGSALLFATPYLPVVPGDYVSVSAIVDGNSNLCYLGVDWLLDTGAYLSASSGAAINPSTNAGARVTSVVGPAPATARYARVRITDNSTWTSGTIWTTCDDFRVVTGDSILSSAKGDVFIDSSGVLIENGKMTFKDAFGSQVLNGYGFGPSWVKFITGKFYNGDFLAGIGTDIPVSQVGTGSTMADYLASLSPNLPSWIVSASGGTLIVATDSTASGGKALKSSGGPTLQVDTIYQDIPISPGQAYRITPIFRLTTAGAGTVIGVSFDWRNSNHTIIGSGGGGSAGFSATVAAYSSIDFNTGILTPSVAPPSAVYLRVYLSITHQTNASNVWISEIKATAAFPYDGNYNTTALTLTTAFQDILSTTLSYGKFFVTAAISVAMTTAGIGDATVEVSLDGVYVSQGVWAAPTATAKGTVTVPAYISVGQGAAGLLKVRAKKSIAAGVVTTSGNSVITIMGAW